MDKILIVEDDSNISLLQRDYLEKAGYEVEVRFSGKDGLEAALNNNYDLIILDIMLPEIDGITVCEKVREVNDIPIIIISAREEEKDKIEALGAGADDYMTKPFSFGEMAARVQAHLQKYKRLTEKNGNDTIKIRNLTIEKLSRRVFLDDEEKILTKLEYELLDFLASNPNKIWNKEELFNAVWGMDAYGDISTVTVHMKKVREKIDIGDKKFIETIWGVGYRFNT